MIEKKKPLVLMILDGWGQSDTLSHNAIRQAKTPTWDKLWVNCPHNLVQTSGQAVGLPEGQMGNSEVGHMNIGMGRIIYQDFTRINKAIDEGVFQQNSVLQNACQQAIDNNRALHILGLCSAGGIHSHEKQIEAMIKLAFEMHVPQIYLHAFLDGRDTLPKSAMQSLQKFEQLSTQFPQFKVVSLIGRYYAMDRDQRWARIEMAYKLLTKGQANFHAATAALALQQAYDAGLTDEFVTACSIHDANEPAITIQDNDSVVFMNFRADRARALTHAFVDPQFDHFERKKISCADFVSLTQYEQGLLKNVAFPPAHMNNGLGEYLSQLDYQQLRVAETEKYAHVTFFFNGGVETPYPNEARILIPSPQVATYDLQPEMSAHEVTDTIVAAIEAQTTDIIICNYANPDMVGHTGNFAATLKAIETIDQCISRVVDALQKVQGELLITADHGNAERMFDEKTQQPHTAHTVDPVPLLYVGRPATFITQSAVLADIAPTILALLGEKQPKEMTGKNLIRLKE
ncbi:MAG: phosphoglycerate mutase (2,3-diphosphoglycerate-independent) [Legionellales bacterium]|nr:phosphoglycerate mutase (2,3-diphosphoglycerate-independent) [Legionellales bacterium]